MSNKFYYRFFFQILNRVSFPIESSSIYWKWTIVTTMNGKLKLKFWEKKNCGFFIRNNDTGEQWTVFERNTHHLCNITNYCNRFSMYTISVFGFNDLHQRFYGENHKVVNNYNSLWQTECSVNNDSTTHMEIGAFIYLK